MRVKDRPAVLINPTRFIRVASIDRFVAFCVGSYCKFLMSR